MGQPEALEVEDNVDAASIGNFRQIAAHYHILDLSDEVVEPRRSVGRRYVDADNSVGVEIVEHYVDGIYIVEPSVIHQGVADHYRLVDQRKAHRRTHGQRQLASREHYLAVAVDV